MWATDEKGTRQILDPKPPVYQVDELTAKCLRANGPKPAFEDPELGRTTTFMTSHWSTCTKAADVKRDQQAKGKGTE